MNHTTNKNYKNKQKVWLCGFFCKNKLQNVANSLNISSHKNEYVQKQHTDDHDDEQYNTAANAQCSTIYICKIQIWKSKDPTGQ